MTVVGGTIRPYRIAFRRPYQLPSGTRAVREGFTVALMDDDGRTGLGEAAPLSSRTETLAQSERAVRQALDRIDGHRTDAGTWLARPTDLVAHGAPCALAALATALMDLASQRAERPLYAWLNDRFNIKATPMSAVPVNATLPAGTPEVTEREARQAVEAGFTTLKIKVGARDDDVARVAAVRDAVGPHVRLRLDANAAWQRDEALQHISSLSPYDIEYFEQPVPAADLQGLAWVRSRCDANIAADEPIVSLEAAQRVLAADAADVLVLKPMVLGGPEATFAIAQYAREHGVDVVISSTIDAVVGRTMAAHVAAALGVRERACGLATGSLLAGDVGHAAVELDRGTLRLSDAPGLGAHLSTEASAR